MPKVSLGPWIPDFGPLGNTGVVEAKNVLPHVQGYKPLRKPLGLKDPGSISGLKITGAHWIESSNRFHFIATTAPIGGSLARIFHCVEDSAWADKTQVTASISATVYWRFANYGSLLIMAGGVDFSTLQKLTISGTGAGPNFENLGGSPGTANWVAVVRDFVVVLGNAGVSNRVKWCALGNAEDWTISATTQSDEQDLNDQRVGTGIIGGEYGLLFFRGAIYRMNYIGPPVIFQFDKIADVGAYNGCVTKLNDNVYFLGAQGFGVVRGGYEALILSSDSIDQYLQHNVLGGVPGGARLSPIMAADPRDRIVAISYMDRATMAGSADKRTNLIFYDEALDRFSRASLTHQWIFNAIVRPRGVGTASLVAFTITNDYLMAVIDESNNLSVFEGDNMRALVETGEGQLNESGRSFVNKVVPCVHGTHAPMVQVGVRERQHQTVSFGATVTANAVNGVAPVRAAGRFHRLRIHMSVSASWSFMTGFEVEGRADGVR